MRKHPLIALVAFAVLATSTFVGAAGAGTFNAVPARVTTPISTKHVKHVKLTAADRKQAAARARYIKAAGRYEALLHAERRAADWRLHGADAAAMHAARRPSGAGMPSAWFRYLTAVAKQDAVLRAQYFADVVAANAANAAAAAQASAAAAAATAAAAAPAAAPAVAGSAGDPGGAWLELRLCESGGNYAEDTGNGYYGAYQFSLATWEGLGYSGLPSDASPATQDQAAQKLQAMSGWGQWPACSAQLGL